MKKDDFDPITMKLVWGGGGIGGATITGHMCTRCGNDGVTGTTAGLPQGWYYLDKEDLPIHVLCKECVNEFKECVKKFSETNE